MNDAVRVSRWHGHHLQPVAGAIRADDDESILAMLLDLYQPDRVGVGVQDVGFGDAVLAPALVNHRLTATRRSTTG